MRRRVTRRTGAALAAAVVAGALVVGLAGPAAAKGPTGVSVAVDGGEPVELTGVRGGASDGAMFESLAEDLGVWELGAVGAGIGGPEGRMSESPTAELGPSVTVLWATYDATPAAPGEPPQVIQTLYPLAEGGPLVHTAAGQPLHPGVTTIGGWVRAPEAVIDTLARAGVEQGTPPSSGFVVAGTPVAPEGQVSADGGAGGAAPSPAADPWWRAGALPAAAGLAAVAVAAAAGVSIVRAQRRRRRALTVAG